MSTELANPQEKVRLITVYEEEKELFSKIIPFAEVTPERSQQMRYKYRDGALARNSKAIGKKDSTSVWLNRATLLELLAISEKNTIGNAEDSGVVAHFAAYDDDYPDERFAGRTTLIFQYDIQSWLGDFPVCPPMCGTGNGCGSACR